MRQKETALNAALKTADTRAICLALDELVRGSSNVSILARDAEIDRSVLYRSFRGEKGPRLFLVMKVLRSLSFQFVVEFDRQPNKIRPNRFSQGSEITLSLNFAITQGRARNF